MVAAVRRSDNGGVVLAEEARRRRFVETVPLGDGKDAARAAILASALPAADSAREHAAVEAHAAAAARCAEAQQTRRGRAASPLLRSAAVRRAALESFVPAYSPDAAATPLAMDQSSAECT